MGRKTRARVGADAVILLSGVALIACMYTQGLERTWLTLFSVLVMVFMIGAAVDLYIQTGRGKQAPAEPASDNNMGIRQLILLDERDKPIKSWDLAGRTAMIIGKKNPEEPVDVDLEDCEYSSFIDPVHAALNFCLESWYIEDLGSQNGVKIKKVEDGICYKVLNRPARLAAGDIIYIANTRLLLS